MDKYNPGETEFMAVLNGLGVPDDLPETVLQQEPAPDKDALKRIRARTLERVHRSITLPPARGRRRRLQAAAAVAAALLLAATLILSAGPSRVLAGVRRMLTLVPGFGPVEEREEWAYALAAADKYRHYYGEGYVELAGLLAHSGGTWLYLYFNGVPDYSMPTIDVRDIPKEEYETYYDSYHAQLAGRLQKIYLVDEAGQEYRDENAPFSLAGGGREHEAGLLLPALPPDTRQVTVVVPVVPEEELRFIVPLVDLKSAGREGEEAAGLTLHNVTVAAMPHYGEDTWFSLLVVPPCPDSRLEEIGRHYPSLPANRPNTLTGAGGREYRRLSRVDVSRGNNYAEIFFEGVEAPETAITLEIPVLLFKAEGQGKATVPVPAGGERIELHQEVDLGRFTVVLAAAERVRYAYGDSLKVYVDLGPAGEETLEYFHLKNTSWSYTVDEATGRMLHFEVPLEGSPRRVKLTLEDPVYSVQGPWIFTFPLPGEEPSVP